MNATQLDALVERRNALMVEISAAPASKEGTPWMADRFDALKAVVRQIEAAAGR